MIFFIAFVWIIISQTPDDKFHLITCDVGQGDATLIIYKNFQILTDGGPPNGKVERCLSRHMPFWDRTIEVVVNTHPQIDHFGGFINVFKNYKVKNFYFNDLGISSKELEVLKNMVGSNGTSVSGASKGTSIRYGLILYDIFYPLENGNPKDPNDYSVQSLVKFGDFEAILTGDIGINMESEVLKNLPNVSPEYIKVPHHGSRNGMIESYLRRFMPKIAVISLGKNNSYGHPHQEVLKMLSDKDIKILRTDEKGDIEIVSNGKEFWVEN